MISAISPGLFYGAGCFETFLSEEGKIFRFSDHLDRLAQGLTYLGISDSRLDRDVIQEQIRTLLEKNNLRKYKSRLRIQISLSGSGEYSDNSNVSLNQIFSARLIKDRSKYRKLILSDTKVIPNSAQPSKLKLSNMLHYRQAYREAEKKGADDAVMMNVDDFVAETSIANIFWMKENTIFTPSTQCDILPGIMRNSIIDILRNMMSFKVLKGRFKVENLLGADLIWCTNSIIDFIPISEIDNYTFDISDHFFNTLKKNLTEYKRLNYTVL